MLGWLRRLLGGGQASPKAEPEAKRVAEPEPEREPEPGSSSVPPPPAVKEQLDAAQARLKETIPPPDEVPD